MNAGREKQKTPMPPVLWLLWNLGVLLFQIGVFVSAAGLILKSLLLGAHTSRWLEGVHFDVSADLMFWVLIISSVCYAITQTLEKWRGW